MASVLARPGLLLLALAAPLTAGTWHVDAAAPCPGTGSVAAPFCTIQAALVAAAPGDEILVGPGQYNEQIDFLGKDVELKSTAGAATTIIDGRGVGTVVTFDGGESRAAQLSGFTLRHGDGIFTEVGAGIHCVGSSPTIADNVIEDSFGSSTGGGIALLGGSPLVIGNVVQNNSADYGAGIYCAQGTTAKIIDNHVLGNGQFGTTGAGINVQDAGVLIEGNLIEGNSSACCSGVYVDSDMEVVVRGNTIRGNYANEGDAAGVFSTPGTLVEDNLIENNAAYGDGAGVYAYGGTYRNNRITGNSTSFGFIVVIRNGASFEGDVISGNDSIVGIVEADATPNPAPIHLSRVTISGHGKFAYSLINFVGSVIAEDCLIADNYGGVVVTTTGHVTLRRCTLTGQDATAVATEMLGHATLESCIVWDNLPIGGFDPSGGPIDATWSIVEGGWPGTGNLDANPLFANAAGGDYSLLAGSPAIDGGNFLDPVTDIDLSGKSRRLDGLLDVGAEVDCGALEFDNVMLATSSPSAGVLKIDVSGTAGLQTWILAAAQPGSLWVEKWGLFGLDLSGPHIITPWPGAPSSLSVNVAPVFSGLPIVLQVLAGPPGQLAFTGNLSNAESIELP